MTVRTFFYTFFTPWFPLLREEGVLFQWALTSAVLILAVLAVRALLKGKVSLRVRYALWTAVALRLLIPAQLPFTLPAAPARLAAELPYQLTYPTVPMYPTAPAPGAVSSEMHYSQDRTQASYVQTMPDGERISVTVPVWTRYQWILLVWWGGVLVTAGAVAASNLRFSRRLRRTRRPLELEGCPLPVCTAEGLPSPCLAGVLRPVIYLTPEAAEDERTRRHVLAHELTHYAHRDHLWGLVRCLCLALHWYNPLVWLAAALSKRDGELACDEGAVARLGEAERIPYGKTLVGLVARRAAPSDLLSCSTAMTGSGRTVRERVELLVKKPHTVKTALFAAVSALALCLLCAFAGGEAPAEVAPSMEELAELLKPSVSLSQTWAQTREDRTLLLVQYPGLAHADGFDDLAVGVWDRAAGEFLPGICTLRGDEARYTAWTEDTGDLYLLCANTATYQGLETSAAPLWLRFRDGELTRLTALPAIARTTAAGESLPSDEVFFHDTENYWMDHKIIPGEGGFTLYERVVDQTFMPPPEPQDQWGEVGFVPLTVLVPGEENTAVSGAWGVSRSFSPDPAAADSWSADFRAAVTGLGDGRAELTVEGGTGALTELGVRSDGLYFTGYGYFETAEPGISWEKDPTFAALNELALRGITEDVQPEVSHWLRVTRDGREVPGTFWGHAMEGEAGFSFDFDQPQSLEKGEQLVIEVGPPVSAVHPLYPAVPAGTQDHQAAAEQFGRLLAQAFRRLDSDDPQAVTYAALSGAEIYEDGIGAFAARITLLVDPAQPGTAEWMAGSGLERDAGTGHWIYQREYLLEEQADGSWRCTDAGTGGVRVPEAKRNLLSAEQVQALLARLPEDAFYDGTAGVPEADSPQLVFALKTAAARLESAAGLKGNEFWRLYGSGGEISSVWLNPLCGQGQEDCVLVGVRRDVQEPYSVYAVRDETFHWLVRKAFRIEGEVDADMLERVREDIDAKIGEMCRTYNESELADCRFTGGDVTRLEELASYPADGGTARLYDIDLALRCEHPENLWLAGGNWVDDQGRLRNDYFVSCLAVLEENGKIVKTAFLSGDETGGDPYAAPEECRKAVLRALDLPAGD